MKCQPPRSPYYKYDFSMCKDPKSFDPLFIENIKDVAETIVEILIVCGIIRWKAEATKSITIKAFEFYDNKRHCFELSIVGGISRNELDKLFKSKCKMTNIEAWWTYTVLKRAVKAFFYETPELSLRNPITEAVQLKEHAFIWQHAAIRTNQMFEHCEHMFYNVQKNCETKIFRLYNELYERLKSRANPVIIEECYPRGCVKKVILGTYTPKLDSERPKCLDNCRNIEEMREYVKNFPVKEFPLKSNSSLCSACKMSFSTDRVSKRTPKQNIQKKKKPKNVDINLPRCYQCNCPQVMCDCKIDRQNGLVGIDCSQGPYSCHWYRDDKIEKPDPCIRKRELHQCPVDCYIWDSSSESDEDSGSKSSDENLTDQIDDLAFEEDDDEETTSKILLKNSQCF